MQIDMSKVSVKILSDNPDSNATTWTMDDVVNYARQYVVYEQQIKDIQESRKEWSADYLKDKGIPKKELSAAISAAKKELEMDVVQEMYENINTIFGGSNE